MLIIIENVYHICLNKFKVVSTDVISLMNMFNILLVVGSKLRPVQHADHRPSSHSKQ